ncbi:MFS transporter [Okibacterium endophyticum]
MTSTVNQVQWDERKARKAARSAAIGTMLEWYDFGIYGSAAALVLNSQFFPSLSPAAGVIASFATFAVGFFARPLGAILFGHLGDTWGRKNTLILTLVITGGGTFAIGLLPTFDSIGIAAPILLVALRFVQGIGMGGEWGGAALFSVEHAPPERRGHYSGIMQMGVPLGVALSNGVFLAVALFVPVEAFADWAWRVPFLASVVVLLFGLWLRFHTDETVDFAVTKSAVRPATKERAPLGVLLRSHKAALLLGLGLVVGNSAVAYIYLAFSLSFGSSAGFTSVELLTSIVVGALVWAATAPIWARIGDKRGGLRWLFVWGGWIRTLAVVPFFPLLLTGDFAALLVTMMVMGVVISATQVPAAAAIPGLFPVPVRYTGASVSYQIGNILGGGIAPLVSAALLAATGSFWAVVVYAVLVSIIGTIGGYWLRKDATAFPSADGEAL